MAVRSDNRSGSRKREAESLPRSVRFLVTWALVALVAFSGFLALGTWQVQRLGWKLDLIDRVNQRVSAPAKPAPSPSQWPQVGARTHAYQHVSASGTFLYGETTFVKASTDLGSGFWAVTPLKQSDESLILINRGFVSKKIRDRSTGTDSETTTVTGLLRIAEPGGGFLRENDPASDRWYSRDVQAIALAKGLNQVAPYFIDADATGDQQPPTSFNETYHEPVGGLTVIAFHNNHLIYAITWYTLALMVALGAFWLAREERRTRRRNARTPEGQV